MLSVTLLAPLFSLLSFEPLNRWVPISHCVHVHQFIFQPFSSLIDSIVQSVKYDMILYINCQVSVSFLFLCMQWFFCKTNYWWIMRHSTHCSITSLKHFIAYFLMTINLQPESNIVEVYYRILGYDTCLG